MCSKTPGPPPAPPEASHCMASSPCAWCVPQQCACGQGSAAGVERDSGSHEADHIRPWITHLAMHIVPLYLQLRRRTATRCARVIWCGAGRFKGAARRHNGRTCSCKSLPHNRLPPARMLWRVTLSGCEIAGNPAEEREARTARSWRLQLVMLALLQAFKRAHRSTLPRTFLAAHRLGPSLVPCSIAVL